MPMHVCRWCVTDVARAEELARAFTDQIWCPCAGFRHGGHLWLDDAMGPDGAQEFAVVREADLAQVESIAFGWMTAGRALTLIRQVASGEGEDDSSAFGAVAPHLIEAPAQPGRCPHCA